MENEKNPIERFEYQPNPYSPIPEGPRKPEKPKRRMGLGILVGALCSGLLVTMLFLGYIASQREDSHPLGSGSGKEDRLVIDSELLDQDTLDKIADIEEYIDRYYLYEEDKDAMRDGILSGLVGSLDDDYAYYYNQEEFQQLMESNTGTYCGIGVQVTQRVDTYDITITKVFRESPAEEAGIRPGDILTHVGDLDVSGMDLNTVVTYIRGKEGSTVELTLYRPENQAELEVTVERRTIDTPSVEWEMLDDNIGYIQLEEFSENTYDQYMKAIDELESQGMEGLLVDVRNNPGGLLDSVVDILDEMLPEGTIVTVRDRDQREEVYTSDPEMSVDLPVVVLVNGNSASAAEIYTAALQDYGVATIVGTQTFGKGIVQTVITLSDRKTALKITTARYYTPKDVCIHGEGIAPDVEVELNEGLETQIEIPKEEDNQLQQAISVLLEKMGR